MACTLKVNALHVHMPGQPMEFLQANGQLTMTTAEGREFTDSESVRLGRQTNPDIGAAIDALMKAVNAEFLKKCPDLTQ